jgi:hypothetical protein
MHVAIALISIPIGPKGNQVEDESQDTSLVVMHLLLKHEQCSLVSSRGKPPTEQFSITIILKTSFIIPPTLIYTNSIL